MGQANQVTESRSPLRLTLAVSLVSIGLIALVLATSLRGMALVTAIALGGAMLASVFLRLPAAIASYVRAHWGPRVEGFFAVGIPPVFALAVAWLTCASFHVASMLGPLHWIDLLYPATGLVVFLMNLGALVSNVVSLGRR